MSIEKIEDFKFNIANFEGPLDLLLYLISKNKKDIFHYWKIYDDDW